MRLTEEEIGLLKDLEKRDRQILGNKPRQGLSRLVTAGYVTVWSLNVSDTSYSITDAGKIALQDALAGGNENLGKKNVTAA